ncbi:hypothetical protein [Rhodococcus ruber]|uniref:hypothetical protein n=1 Tax=Rhodococcus ruber TaxID=1830 RepID=UPI001F20286D|nr:hypothetical protein [Rhodococcus ruber]MCF8786889.1 hypothetical protein [Rhodococcus ruber]
MSGYFGDEPTCARCDYPRRLHHLLRVGHDYEPGPSDDDPGLALVDEPTIEPAATAAAALSPGDCDVVELADVAAGPGMRMVLERMIYRDDQTGELHGPDWTVQFVSTDNERPRTAAADIPERVAQLHELHALWSRHCEQQPVRTPGPLGVLADDGSTATVFTPGDEPDHVAVSVDPATSDGHGVTVHLSSLRALRLARLLTEAAFATREAS